MLRAHVLFAGYYHIYNLGWNDESSKLEYLVAVPESVIQLMIIYRFPRSVCICV